MSQNKSEEVRYRIYPSLLNLFENYLDSDMEAEGFWNIDRETGEMKESPDEIALKNEGRLLDAINRVEQEPSEAADKGTCFNEIVDCLIERRGSANDAICLDKGIIDSNGAFERTDDGRAATIIRASMDGFEFLFDRKLCEEAAAYLGGAERLWTPQHFCTGTLGTSYGAVALYGYADGVVRNKVFDIKTTSSYSFGKYERGWQHLLYPWCLVKSGEMREVSEFEYAVFQLTKTSGRTPFISGTRYAEVYTYDHASAEKRLRSHVERFIEWLESNRERVTDEKIFNYRKPCI